MEYVKRGTCHDATYGKEGHEFIEAHDRIRAEQQKENEKNKKNDANGEVEWEKSSDTDTKSANDASDSFFRRTFIDQYRKESRNSEKLPIENIPMVDSFEIGVENLLFLWSSLDRA